MGPWPRDPPSVQHPGYWFKSCVETTWVGKCWVVFFSFPKERTKEPVCKDQAYMGCLI